MNKEFTSRVHELFTAALELPDDQERKNWLIEECGSDKSLLEEVLSLLEYDSLEQSPLEGGLKCFLDDVPLDEIADGPNPENLSDNETTQVIDCDTFLSKLSELSGVGVLSKDEIRALREAAKSSEDSSNPRLIASNLVSEGKLTEYQASALLKGSPELLIQKYLILDLIDVGGMGMVFKAIHRTMNRVVAIKMISQNLFSSPEQIKRFQREVRVAATLDHPNVVRSFDADQTNGVHFLVMEYVSGSNLSQVIRDKGPLTLEQAVYCILQAARGLRYAHKRGIIHRDIKPGNLMIDKDEKIKVLDLGLANVDESLREYSTVLAGKSDMHNTTQTELTNPGMMLGTISYMAPEQSLDASRADSRSDIYSLGCTFYFLLIGEPPFQGDSIFKIFLQHQNQNISSIRELRQDVPQAIEDIYLKMLAKNPDERFQTMGELISALEECEISLPKGNIFKEVHESKRENRINKRIKTRAQPSDIENPRSSFRQINKNWFLLIPVIFLILGFGSYQILKPRPSKEERVPSPVTSVSIPAKPSPSKSEHSSPPPRIKPVKQDAPPPDISVGMKFKLIKSGTFQMGSDSDWESSKPAHSVTLTKPFEMSIYEVTQKQYETVTGTNPSYFKGANNPVESVSWKDATKFCRILSEMPAEKAAGYHYRLPTEAEWEYAYRAGTTTKYWFGDDETQFSNYGWFIENADRTTHPVGKKEPNPWGLYDMSGNVYEWCQDVYGSYPDKKVIDPQGKQSGLDRVLRGGGIRNEAPFCSSIHRYHVPWGLRRDDWGFRIVRESIDHTESSGNLTQKEIEERSLPAADLLATGEWEWKVIKKLDAPINSSASDSCADMTADGLSIVFSSSRNLSDTRQQDLWMSTREYVTSPWSPPVKLGKNINTDGIENQPTISADGLELMFSRKSAGKWQVFSSKRESLQTLWQDDIVFGAQVSYQVAADISNDGLTLITSRGPGNKEQKWNPDIWIASRPLKTAKWGPMSPLDLPINTRQWEVEGTISADGRMIIFTRVLSDRDRDIIEKHKLFVCVREGRDTPWSDPILIEGSLTPWHDRNPRLLAGDKTLLFSSDRSENIDYFNIYEARLVKKNNALSKNE